ncbi:BlaI/MecI/CopY family transcriptional regulator [Streptomyces sp. NPDC001514]
MPEPAHVLDEYARRIREDTEANLLQQEELRSRLRVLEEEHAVLANMRKTLESAADALAGATTESVAPAKAHDPATRRVPRPAAAAPRGNGRGGWGGKDGDKSLIDVVATVLRRQNEPRSVSEILDQVVSVRPTTEQTVRNTLDRLVAGSRAERTKQGRSVFYSAVDVTRPAAGDDTDEDEAALTQAAS